MKKLIVLLFTLISLNAFSQQSGLTILVKTERSSFMIEGGLILTTIGFITPPQYIQSNGNWIPKPMYKQPNRYMPVYLGVSFILTGYIDRLVRDRK